MNRLALRCMCLCILASPALAQFDQVTPLRGSPMNGEVVAVSPEAVKIKVAGLDRTVAVNEIKRVAFKEDPQELRTARTKAINGDYQAGLDMLKRINAASLERKLIQQDFQFYAAYCMGKLALTKGGDKKRAADLMLKFVGANANSHHFFTAAELLGDLALAMGSLPGAVRYYGAIASKAPWPAYRTRGMLLTARAQAAQGDYATAQQQFDAIIASKVATSPELKRMQLLAQVGRARCVAHTGTPEEAITSLESLIASSDEADTELFGRAYNALGQSYLLKEQSKDALMAFLHVDVLFFSDADTHAEALHHLTGLWDTLKNPDRAAAARNMLTDRYAGSRWANL